MSRLLEQAFDFLFDPVGENITFEGLMNKRVQTAMFLSAF